MDWSRLVRELQEAGLTQQEIADHCGASQSTVSDWANKDAKRGPSWDSAQRLIALHKARVRKGRAKAAA